MDGLAEVLGGEVGRQAFAQRGRQGAQTVGGEAECFGVTGVGYYDVGGSGIGGKYSGYRFAQVFNSRTMQGRAV